MAAVAAGGVIGALGRVGLAAALPPAAGAFPWATFVTNVAGCLLIGALGVAFTEVRRVPPLLPPFLGVGVLGGFTTFSGYAVEIQGAADRAPWLALGYLAGTLACALPAVWAGAAVVRLAGRGIRLRRVHPGEERA